MLNIIVETLFNLIKINTQIKVKGFNQTFDNCPRCGGKWIRARLFDRRCEKNNCILAMDALEGLYEILVLSLRTYQIQWYSEYCVVNNLEVQKQFIKMNYLPYDITEDQLRIYLTFS